MRTSRMLAAYVLIAVVQTATAEPRRTLESVTLRKKPGERAPAVVQLPANTPVTVLAVEGRWLRVRTRAGEGYLTRTTVSDPPADAPAPAGRWSAGRRAQDALVASMFVEVVADDAVLRTEPRAEATAVATVARGARLIVVDAAGDPDWVRVREPGGRAGWIARPLVGNGASSVVVAAVAPSVIARVAGGGRAPRAALAVRAELGVGFRALGMALTSNADGGLANYVLAADAVAATLAVDVAARPSGRLVFGADVRASGSDSSPGVAYAGPTGPAGTIAFRTLAGDAGLRIGARARDAFEIALRAGGHYDTFFAADVDNAGRLPRERLAGATLGVRVDIAPAPSRITVSTRFDALVLGWRRQTRGLEDGPASAAHGLWGGITMRYALLPHVGVFGGYELGRASTVWSGTSTRQPGATHTQRVDTAQLVQLGISTEL